MPGWPVPEGIRCLTFTLPVELVAHLDARAVKEGCSRAAFIRRLIIDDRKRNARKG